METRRALVVEDNPDSRAALCELLGEWGYAVEVAEDVDRALSLAGSRRPDVVVIDLWLCDDAGDALDVIAEIRASDKHVFIVVFSGWHHLRDAAIAAGADAYILKPDIDALEQLLDRPTLPTRVALRPRETDRKSKT
jgi:two-component system, OmpR family, KDP operon response regulator KdpE